MKTISLKVTDAQYANLKKSAKRKGVGSSDVIRNLLDGAFAKKKVKAKPAAKATKAAKPAVKKAKSAKPAPKKVAAKKPAKKAQGSRPRN